MAKKITLKNVESFRRTWQKFIKDSIKGRFVGPVPMVNNGYLHTLNASFDGLFLREQKSDSLLVANHKMNFGTIQPCIRTEDKLSIKKSLIHLGLFEICGFSILDFKKVTPEWMAEKTIADFFTFYTRYLKLDPKKLKIYYFGGGTLRKITNGRIKSDDYIEPDNFSVRIWKKYGLDESQLIPEYSNETFLLHIGNPLREHHSGYRNDIFINLKDASFEIATLNLISHQTVIKDGVIIGIKPLPFYLREMAIGQERFLVAMNGMKNIYLLPHVQPLLERVSKYIKDKRKAMIYTDALRVVHYFFSDGWTYDKMRGPKYKEHRHEMNKFMDIITSYGKNLAPKELNELLNLNARLQPWYPILRSGIKTTTQEIEAYPKRKK